jgi:putative membrane protein
MYWGPHDMNGWGWFTMSFGTVFFWAVLALLGVLVHRALGRGSVRTPTGGTPPTPEQTLAHRYARGEIDEDEYRRRLAVLREDVPRREEHAP